MRRWRDEALAQNLLESAGFWGDKICSITGDPLDEFQLAQIYYQNSEYQRSIKISLKLDSNWGKHLTALSFVFYSHLAKD